MSEHQDRLLSSEDLMVRVAKGDRSAFEILVRRHQQGVLNLTYRFVGSEARAEDLAQEVFIRVWKAAGRYRPTAKFSTWIYRIATNLCLNEVRSSLRRKLVFFSSDGRGGDPGGGDFEQNPGRLSSPEDLLITAERKRQVLTALQSLPANQRLAVILKRYHDLSYKEIARILGCSVSAVESLLVRARRNLHKKLSPYEE